METAAHAIVLLAWASVLGHGVVRVARAAPLRAVAGVAIGAAAVAAGIALERHAGARPAPPPPLAAGGAAMVVGGAWLHRRARRALGAGWSSRLVPEATALVEDGPYARVRNPIYLAILVMTLGTVATHPTPTALLALAGVVVAVALKIAGEERALAAEFGPRWDAYRARVPRLVPRLSRGRRR